MPELGLNTQQGFEYPGFDSNSIKDYNDSAGNLKNVFTNNAGTNIAQEHGVDYSVELLPAHAFVGTGHLDLTYSVSDGGTWDVDNILKYMEGKDVTVVIQSPFEDSISQAFERTARNNLNPLDLAHKDLSTGKASLMVNGSSYHIGQRTINGTDIPLEEANIGSGIEYRLNDTTHISIEKFINSYGNISDYFSLGFETGGNKPIGVGISYGVATNYDFANIAPSVLPYVRIGARDEINAKVGIIAPIQVDGEQITPTVITLQARIPLDGP